MTRFTLLTDHTFNKACGPVVVEAGSIVGDGAGDYQTSDIIGFKATSGMTGLDAGGIAAVTAHAGGLVGADGPGVAAAPAGSYAKHPAARGTATWNLRP